MFYNGGERVGLHVCTYVFGCGMERSHLVHGRQQQQSLTRNRTRMYCCIDPKRAVKLQSSLHSLLYSDKNQDCNFEFEFDSMKKGDNYVYRL